MVPLADLRPWETNYRHHPAEQLDRIRESLRRNGQRKAVVVQASTMRIVAGHGVAEAMRLEGYTEARCDVWDCSDEQAAAYLVDDNELSRHAVDDEAQLAALLLELQDTQYSPVSFNEAEIEALLAQAATPGPFPENEDRQTLAERFGVPPFSVLDARQGYWQERKRAWLSLGIQSELGRGAAPGGAMMPASKIGADGKFARADLHMGMKNER